LEGGEFFNDLKIQLIIEKQRFNTIDYINRDLTICVLMATGEGIGGGVLESGAKYNNNIIVGQDLGLSNLPGRKLFNNYKIF
jgi:hypothetical protein